MASGIASMPNIESKMKRGKSDAARTSSTGTDTPAADAGAQALPSDLATNSVDGAGDSLYMKELNK
jgi:hypothetical protein